jgi:hypothetical protein
MGNREYMLQSNVKTNDTTILCSKLIIMTTIYSFIIIQGEPRPPPRSILQSTYFNWVNHLPRIDLSSMVLDVVVVVVIISLSVVRDLLSFRVTFFMIRDPQSLMGLTFWRCDLHYYLIWCMNSYSTNVVVGSFHCIS